MRASQAMPLLKRLPPQPLCVPSHLAKPDPAPSSTYLPCAPLRPHTFKHHLPALRTLAPSRLQASPALRTLTSTSRISPRAPTPGTGSKGKTALNSPFTSSSCSSRRPSYPWVHALSAFGPHSLTPSFSNTPQGLRH